MPACCPKKDIFLLRTCFSHQILKPLKTKAVFQRIALPSLEMSRKSVVRIQREGAINEVEQVVDRRLNPLTQTFEYLVRFKGYSESDDLWLPASSFNMPVNYVSVSRFGRKRKSCTNIDESGTDENAGAPKQKYTKSFHQTFRSSTHDQGGKSVKASNSRS